MCKKADAFFYYKNFKTSIKKPEGFNHFMLKEILETKQEMVKNLSFYSTNNNRPKEFTKQLQKADRVQIFAPNELFYVGVFCKNALKTKFLKQVELVKIDDKNQQFLFNEKDDISIFLLSKEEPCFIDKLNTRKVVFYNCSDKICKNNFNLSFPVFVDKEEIKILSKTLLVFAFVFLLSLFGCDTESLSSAKIACDAIDDFDIIQVVDFSRRIAKTNSLSLVGKGELCCFDLVFDFFKKITNLSLNKIRDIPKCCDDVLSDSYLFFSKEESALRIFNDNLFCLKNLGANFFSLIKTKEDFDDESNVVLLNNNLGLFVEIVFIFYIQLTAFYVSLFQGKNPDLIV